MFSRTPNETRREFEQVALPQADALFNFAVKMTRNRRDAEDLVQDAYMRAFRFFHRFEPGTNIRAWLFRILKNTYINNYRKVQRTPDHVDWAQVEEFYDTVTPIDLLKRHKNPEELLLENGVDGRIQEAIGELPEEYRAVVLLNFVEEMSYREIAQILEIPMGTVMSRLHRGRKFLKKRLHDFADEQGLLADSEDRADQVDEAAGSSNDSSTGQDQIVTLEEYRRRAGNK
jgi:RNA polymerase sigma-70 factor (ECF subfamily)